MEPRIVGGTYHDPHTDDPAFCERCGAPIANEIFVQDELGEIHSYGSTCACRVVGDAETERRTREAMEQRNQEHDRIESAMRNFDPERQRKLQHIAELNKTDPSAALRALYEMHKETK